MNYNAQTVLNVACAGIFPNTEISNTLNSLIASSVNKIEGIQFNDGTYILDSPVYLDSISYLGTQYTTLSVSKDFQTNDDKIITSPSIDGTFYDL